MRIEPVDAGVWWTLALINAGLAQGKQRSGLAWFLISVFLGPVATLLIVLLPREDEQQRLSRNELLIVAAALVVVALAGVITFVSMPGSSGVSPVRP